MTLVCNPLDYADAGSAMGEVARVLELNYAMADHPNRDVPNPPVQEAVPVPIELPPSARGSHEDEPWGWALVADAVGYVWPNGIPHGRTLAETVRPVLPQEVPAP